MMIKPVLTLLSLFAIITFASSQPTVSWKLKTDGKIYSTPAVVGNTVYVGSEDQYIYAVDRQSGAIRWKFKTGGAVYSSPALHKDKLFVSSHDGVVYALKASTGVVLWKYQTGGETFYDLWDYFLSSPTVHNGSVYIGSGDHHVYALDENTGAVRWKFQTEGLVHASPIVRDNVLYAGSYDGNLYALDAKTGLQRWKFKTDGEQYFPKGEIQREVIVHNGVVYSGSRDYNSYAVNAADGKLVWKVKEEGSWVIAPYAVYKDNLYFGTSDSHSFICMDSKTGSIRWRTKMKMRIFAKALVVGNQLIAGCFDGRVYAFNADTGAIEWSFETDGSKAHYYDVYGADGQFKPGFTLYGENTHAAEATLLSLGSVLSSPIVDRDVLYVGSADGNLYALKLP
jgi:outer membrane protein assembly factor BamB